MALEIDGFAVLRSIVADRSAFPDIRSEINKVARALVTKQLKAKGITLAGLRGIQASLGDDALKLIVEGMTDAEVKSLLAKLDKHHPELKTGAAGWRRRRIIDLAADAEPAPKAEKSKTSRTRMSASPKKQIKRPVGNTAMAAVWDGRNIDEDDEAAPPKKPKRAAGRARSTKATR